MANKKLSGNKTDRYINLILTIANSSGWFISENRLKELLGNPSKSQYYNYLQDLLTEGIDRPAILIKIKIGEEVAYKLHDKTWSNFLIAKDEGQYLLEINKKLSYLLGNEFLEMTYESQNSAQLNKKFIYLTPVFAKPFNLIQKKNLQLIIESLIANTKLRIKYKEKFYLVYPISLCQYRDDLYLVGAKGSLEKKNLRNFKISRVTQIEKLNDEFKYPNEQIWNPDLYYKNFGGMIANEPKTAQIKVYGNARSIFKDKVFFGSELVNEEKDFDIYNCHYTSESEFLGQIFIYADEIEIMSPNSLIESFISKAKTALEKSSYYLKKAA